MLIPAIHNRNVPRYAQIRSFVQDARVRLNMAYDMQRTIPQANEELINVSRALVQAVDELLHELNKMARPVSENDGLK